MLLTRAGAHTQDTGENGRLFTPFTRELFQRLRFLTGFPNAARRDKRELAKAKRMRTVDVRQEQPWWMRLPRAPK
jgi:hypothetical protein